MLVILTIDVFQKLRTTSYSTAVMIGKTLHEHKSQSHQVWDAWHGIAEKNLAPTGLSNVGGYPSETHLNLKSRKISLANNIPFSLHMILIFCTDHVSITAVQCTTFQNDWGADIWNKLYMGKRDFAWFEFKIRFWQISLVAQGSWLWSWTKKYQPLPGASTSYHDFTKIRYPIILLKDEHQQNTKILWSLLSRREWLSITFRNYPCRMILDYDEPLNIVISFKYIYMIISWSLPLQLFSCIIKISVSLK